MQKNTYICFLKNKNLEISQTNLYRKIKGKGLQGFFE